MSRPRRKPADSQPPPATLPLVAGDAQAEDQEQGPELLDRPPCEIPSARTEWLWLDHLEWRTVAFIQGEKRAGKSTWLRALAAAVTGGPPLPGMPRRKRTLGGVLWYAGEEDLGSRVVPGLLAAGANLDLVYCADCHCEDSARQLRLPGDCDRLRRRIMARSTVLVVIDPIFDFLDGTLDVESSGMDGRELIRRLTRVCRDTGALIVCTRNLTKDTSKGALAAGRGGGELGNAARAVLHLQLVPGSRDRGALAVAACNAGKPTPTLTYQLADVDSIPVIRHTGHSELTADQLVAGEEGDLDRWQVDKAKALIRSLIPSGELDSRTIRGKAEAAMIALRTLQNAARQLGVRFRREGTRESTVVYWMPPKGGWAS